MADYTPPAGYRVAVSFTGSYTAPDGYRVALEFTPDSGTPVTTQYVFPSSFTSSTYGTPSIVNISRFLFGSGWSSSAFGTGAISNLQRFLLPGGIAPPPSTGTNQFRQIPSPDIQLLLKFVYPGGIAAGSVGAAEISHWIRYLDLAARGIVPGSVGTQLVAYAQRDIYPTTVVSMVFGTPLVARNQTLDPIGWESSTISTGARLDINLQRLTGHGWASTTYGDPVIRNEHEIVVPQTILPGAPGFPVVYNLTQSIAQGPFAENVAPDEWPNYAPYVENVIRYLGASGWQSSRFSGLGHDVHNNAVPVLPAGLDSTLFGGDTFISHFERTIALEGINEFYSSQYQAVYNTAAVLTPMGWSSMVFGTPNPVKNLNQFVQQHSGELGPFWGLPFIAPAIRTIQSGLFYDVPQGIPEVRLNPVPVAPAGWDSYRTSATDVTSFRAIISPPTFNMHPNPLIGEPLVVNRNKQLFVGPTDQSEYGRARVFNFVQYVDAIGSDGFTMPVLHNISYRTKILVPQAISVPTFTVIHRIQNLIPDPPGHQIIAVPDITPSLRFGTPRLNVWHVYVPDIPPPSPAVSNPAVTRNTIEPQTIIGLDQVGQPSIVYTQYAYPPGAPWPRVGNTNADGSVGDSDQFSHEAVARLTPHTIYAPDGDQATNQARTNHPGNHHEIDHLPPNGHPWFGEPSVSNQYRTIGPVPNHGGVGSSLDPTVRFGEPTLDLRRRYIYPFPNRSQRFGLPLILDVPQWITFEWFGGFESSVVGEPTVSRPYVFSQPHPSGWNSFVAGTHRVELFNREITATGIPHRGNPQEGLTNPWGIPLVGYPRVYQWGGGNMLLMSDTTRVEFRIRDIYPQGWDASQDGADELSDWADRMRVSRRNPAGALAGIASTMVWGTALVAYSNRTVLGRGLSSYNSGQHVVKASSILAPTGWESLVVGDIDEWEAGKIKPHGDDLSLVGTPRMLRPLVGSGIAAGSVPSPRVGVPIYCAGMPEIGFAGPSVSNPFGCTNRVVTPLPILSTQAVPQPVVT